MSGTDYLPTLLNQLRQSDPPVVRALLEGAARAHSWDARPLVLLAAEHVHAKELDLAEATYIAALQRAPDLAIARFQLGLLQFTSARPAAARASWAPLDGLEEKDPLRLFKTGLELLGEDRFDEARRWLEEGIARNQSNPPLSRDMQMVLDEMARRNLTGAGPANAVDDRAVAPEGHFLVSSYGKVH